jgi:hypothetical protein
MDRIVEYKAEVWSSVLGFESPLKSTRHGITGLVLGARIRSTSPTGFRNAPNYDKVASTWMFVWGEKYQKARLTAPTNHQVPSGQITDLEG